MVFVLPNFIVVQLDNVKISNYKILALPSYRHSEDLWSPLFQKNGKDEKSPVV